MLSAHPHIISVLYPHIYFDEKGMSGFYIQWIYDPMYSSQIIYNVDTDMNMELNEEEEIEAKEILYSLLESESWFMTILVDGVNRNVPDPLSFSVEIDKDDETILFTYYIPLPLAYKRGGTDVHIEFTDPSQYTAFKIPLDTLTPVGESAVFNRVDINYSGYINYNFSRK